MKKAQLILWLLLGLLVTSRLSTLADSAPDSSLHISLKRQGTNLVYYINDREVNPAQFLFAIRRMTVASQNRSQSPIHITTPEGQSVQLKDVADLLRMLHDLNVHSVGFGKMEEQDRDYMDGSVTWLVFNDVSNRLNREAKEQGTKQADRDLLRYGAIGGVFLSLCIVVVVIVGHRIWQKLTSKSARNA